MKVVFISGPYNAPTVYEREQNMRKAEALALRVWQAGHVGVCVHSMNRYFFGSFSEEHAYAGDMELMRRCDAVLFADTWPESPGARKERIVALREGIPVFYEENFPAFEAWANSDVDDQETREGVR